MRIEYGKTSFVYFSYFFVCFVFVEKKVRVLLFERRSHTISIRSNWGFLR